MGTPKNPKPNKEKMGKMGGYESIPTIHKSCQIHGN
jgi:hypothetical protein